MLAGVKEYDLLLRYLSFFYKYLISLPPVVFFKYNFAASILSLIGRNSADS